jgi:hypothetical protein
MANNDDGFRPAQWLMGLFAAAVLVASLAAAPAPPPGGSAANVPGKMPVANVSPGTPPLGQNKPAERLRENTRLVDVTGTFQATGGDSVSFSPSGNKDSLRVLENLALERISRTLDENRGSRQWVVSGTVTEYRGNNYLLVTKAVIQLQEGDSASGQ